MTYFAAIAADDAKELIYGIGTTAAEAIADAKEYGANTDYLRAVACTEDLYREVAERGGDVRFEEANGTLILA